MVKTISAAMLELKKFAMETFTPKLCDNKSSIAISSSQPPPESRPNLKNAFIVLLVDIGLLNKNPGCGASIAALSANALASNQATHRCFPAPRAMKAQECSLTCKAKQLHKLNVAGEIRSGCRR